MGRLTTDQTMGANRSIHINPDTDWVANLLVVPAWVLAGWTALSSRRSSPGGLLSITTAAGCCRHSVEAVGGEVLF